MSIYISEYTSGGRLDGTPVIVTNAWLSLIEATEHTKDFIIENFPAPHSEKQDFSINHAIVIGDTREASKCLNILFPSPKTCEKL